MVRHRALLCIAAALVALPAIGSGQHETARLEGTVTALSSGQPLAGVLIAVPAVRAFAVSDPAGRFSLSSLPAGRVVVRILREPHTPFEHTFALRAGSVTRLSVIVDVEAVELAPVVVRADGATDRWGMAGFHARRRIGFGHFLTRDDIALRGARRLSDAISGAGVFMSCTPAGCGPVAYSRGRRCLLSVLVNGMPAFGEDLETIPLDEVGGVEVYRNDAYLPFEFRVGRLLTLGSRFGGGFGGRCGTVLVWTRDWRSELPADW